MTAATFEVVPHPLGAGARDILGEGPFWSEVEQALYWTDIVGRRAYRVHPSSGVGRSWSAPSPFAAAIPSLSGDLIAALADGLHRLDPDTGALTAFVRPDPDPANRSNETRCDPQGRIWLGTMTNNIAADGSPVPITRSSGGFFCVRPDGSWKQMLSGLGISNTLAWSPDGTRFYCADTVPNVMWSFAYDPEGPTLSDRRVFVEGGEGGIDGSAMDEEGGLWNARWGAGRVVRYAPDGRVDRVVELPVRQPSSCTFGGPDRKTLFVTSARFEQDGLAPEALDGSVLAVRVDVAGLPLTPFAG
jgi:sugar lactone lactonase YvrE